MSNETAGTAALGRPAPPEVLPPAGMHWAARPADPRAWRLADGGTCRWRGSGEPAACGDGAVLELRRGIKRVTWWRYCLKHSYGRWAEEDGGQAVVMEYAAEPDGEAPR